MSALALLVYLGGCADPWDGSWLFVLQFSQDTCDDEDARIGAEVEVLGAIWRTAEQNAVARLGAEGEGPLLVGPYEGDVFHGELSGVTDLASACEVDEIALSMAMDARLTADGGLAGTVDTSTRRTTTNCGDDDDVDDTCTNHYALTGLRLDDGGAVIDDGAHWGYFSGPSTY